MIRIAYFWALLGSVLFGAAVAQPSETVREFVIDSQRSDLHWRVYKAGAFARLGHNHVIFARGVSGSIALGDPSRTEWQLEFDVADLVVDDPELRSRYGEDFSSKPSEDDIGGTKRNMLSEGVLNGEEFATITLAGRAYSGPLSDATLPVVISILGRAIALELPAKIDVAGNTLIAEGSFSLQHEDLEMKPFSVMMGALQVGAQLDFSYRIYAVESD
jgi:hypothetical protein